MTTRLDKILVDAIHAGTISPTEAVAVNAALIMSYDEYILRKTVAPKYRTDEDWEKEFGTETFAAMKGLLKE